MRLRDVGEFGLIDRIARRAARRAGRSAPGVVLGIGDDAALLRLRAGEDLAVSTDAAVEGVHFRWGRARPREIGRRAFLAALSDLAATGARPLGFTFALGAPPSLRLALLEPCLDGMLAEAMAAGCPLVGGNVTRAPVTSFTLTVLGGVRRGRALRRDAARPGDRIFVTGALGAAALDVARSERGRGVVRNVPVSRLAAGRALARLPEVGACIDVSDGLLADLCHVLAASKVGARIDPTRVPLPRGFRAACRRLRLDASSLALLGGEDYELLFTLRPSGPSEKALARRLRAPVREIGCITRGRGLRGISARGFTHF